MDNNKRITYHEIIADRYIERMHDILDSFPSFTKQYFRAIEPRTSSKTRLSYAYDLKVFFGFLQVKNPLYMILITVWLIPLWQGLTQAKQ